MFSLLNVTRREHLCIGKPGEEPPFATLRFLQRNACWSASDIVELCDDETARETLGFLLGDDKGNAEGGEQPGKGKHVARDISREHPWSAPPVAVD